jgi:hypothetical protein
MLCLPCPHACCDPSPSCLLPSCLLRPLMLFLPCRASRGLWSSSSCANPPSLLLYLSCTSQSTISPLIPLIIDNQLNLTPTTLSPFHPPPSLALNLDRFSLLSFSRTRALSQGFLPEYGGEGGFVVIGGKLGFNTFIFSVLCCVCFLLLAISRSRPLTPQPSTLTCLPVVARPL